MHLKFIIGCIIVFMISNASCETYNHAGLSFTYSNQYQANLGPMHNVMLSQEWQTLRSVLGLSHTVIHVMAVPNDERTPEEITKDWMSMEFDTPIITSQVPTYVKGVYKALVTNYDVDLDNHALVAWSEPNVNYLIISSSIPGWWQRTDSSGEGVEAVLTIAKSLKFDRI